MPILQNRVVLALKIWRVFMASETRLVILLPLETKLVALDNTVKLSCAFVQYYRNQRLLPRNWAKITKEDILWRAP